MRLRVFATALLGAWAIHCAAFEISTALEEIPESNPVTRTRVADGKTLFSFIAPRNFVMSTDPGAKRLTLQSGSSPATIVIRLATNAIPANAVQFKAKLEKDYKEVATLAEFSSASGGAPGLAIDFKHVIGGKIPMRTRLAVFPAPEGSAEVSISTIPEESAKLHLLWTEFINSFRVEARTPSKQ